MRRLSRSLMVGGLAGGLLTRPPLAPTALAHKTEVSGDVAGTWHLEPNHSPKAGELAQVWVALTQQGGRVIPLEQCDCQLAIYPAGGEEGPPVLEPTLEPISAETYQGIPGADVTFPEIGEYRLVLRGTPQAGAAFAPFEFSYTTVVAAGRGNPPQSGAQSEPAATTRAGAGGGASTAVQPETATVPQPATQPLLTPWIVGSLVVLAAVMVAAVRLKSRQSDV
jgi:hypothetical protein